MSDINRVPITYASKSVCNKTKNVNKKTVRIAVKLPQSNEDTCPEYNFKDELDAAKKRGTSKNPENGGMLDMFEDDDGDVKRIAMQMEEKYGKSVGAAKKKRRNRKDDYADIGMGYDETDPFIDNTDGYDEIIPQNVTTLHGGFYINCGALEFKTDSEESMDSSSSSSDSSTPSRNGKRAVESDDDSVDGDKNAVKKPKLESGINGMQKAIKKKLFSSNKIIKKKRSSHIHKKTVKDLLKEKRKDLNLSVQSSTTDAETPVFGEGETKLENGNNNRTSSITDAIESVVKAADEPNLGGDRLSSQKVETTMPISLPENLPNNIAEVISKLKQTASNSKGSSKISDEMNSQLLSLERKCKCLGKPSKIKVYEHLSHFIGVEKQVLMQHGNQLLLKDEEKKIKSLLHKLKIEIDKVMPSIICNYEKECELVLEKRSLLQQLSQDGEEKKKSIGRPKRKFQWNDQTRKYLKDTAIIRKKSYLQQGIPKEMWEEELTSFLKNTVLHLWPEGWMTMTSLTKMCNKLFSDPKTSNITPTSVTKKDLKITATNTSPSQPYPILSISSTPNSQSNKIPSKPNSLEKSSEIVKKPKATTIERVLDCSKPKPNLQDRGFDPSKSKTSFNEKSIDVSKPKMNLSDKPFDIHKPKPNINERNVLDRSFDSNKPRTGLTEKIIDVNKPKMNLNEKPFDINKTKMNLTEKPYDMNKPRTSLTEKIVDVNKPKMNLSEKPYDMNKPKTSSIERSFDPNKPKSSSVERAADYSKPKTIQNDRNFEINKSKTHFPDYNRPKSNPNERIYEANKSKPYPEERIFDYSKPKTGWNERAFETHKPNLLNLSDKTFDTNKPKLNLNDAMFEAHKQDITNNLLLKEYKESLLRDFVYKDYYKHKEKMEAMDVEFDKKNNNGNTFFKIDYDKPTTSSSTAKQIESFKEIKETAKLPNISIIELDNPNCFDNILPRSKPKPKSEYDFTNPSNLTIKSIPSESNIRPPRERSVITEYEKPISVNSSFEDSHLNVSGNEDIQKVMEHLKNLQKMSSPIKTFEGSSSSNTGFSQKSSSVIKNNIDFMASSFQDEFQKQLFSALGHLAPSTSKSNYKCS